MTFRVKQSATLQFTVEFEDEEWAALYPWDAIEIDFSQRVGGTEVKYDTEIEVLAEEKAIFVTAETDTWQVGPAKADIRFTKGNIIKVYPSDGVINFQILETVTLGDTT